jgi:glutathione synthase/RimK-type ligase-like ATP-grasp enzyme
VILVWGVRDDSTTAAVLAQLDRRHAAVFFLDQDTPPSDVELDVTTDVRATVTVGGRVTELSGISGAFLRPYARAAAMDELLWSWADIAPTRVVNRPRAMAPNGSKPFQARQIRAQGFAVPETLLTTDAAAAEAFWRGHGQVIYKSISGERSIVSRFQPAELTRLADLASCPVQFQQYVPGTDHRVHVIGGDVHCARVDSDADDYRYATRQNGRAQVVPGKLPDEVADRCLALHRAQGLEVSGIDLRRTPDGEWFCFEVNPAPAFSSFDPDGRIAAAVAALLDS